MDLKCKLVEKTFTDKDGNQRSYYALVFKLADDTSLDITVKGDKAKLLKLSNNINTNNSMPDVDWLKG